jgi:Tfp pilus assembly protein PilF
MNAATVEAVGARLHAWLHDAFARHRAGDIAAAAAGYETVLSGDPANVDALHLLGVCRRQAGRPEDAAALIGRALERAPACVDAWHNYGNALADLDRTAEAAAAFARATELRPAYIDAWERLAAMLARLGRREDAIEAYRRALALDPGHVAARNDLANLLTGCGRDEEAVVLFRDLLGDHPDLPEAHYNLALALLRLGDFAGGLSAYEWRWRCAGFSAPRRHTDLAAWDGRPFPGRRLLVHAEQGLGDSIQFARFVPLAASLGGAVSFEVPRVLRRLMAPIGGVDRLLTQGEAVTDADLEVPLASLPHRLGLSLGAVGMRAPYLAAEPERIAHWRPRLGDDGTLRIGVSWRGNPASPADPGRSLADATPLAPLAAVPGVRLIALALPRPGELAPDASAPTGWRLAGLPFALAHPGPDLDAGGDAFVDTAAVMAGLDLIITTDTALAHLAGALGRPVWVLLQAAPDWRWLKGRADSPWYPSMRLFRQSTPGDWAGVIATVACALGERTKLASANG